MPTPRLIDAPQWWQVLPAQPSVERPADGVRYTVTPRIDGDTTTWALTVRNGHPSLTLTRLSVDLGPLPWPPTDYGRVEAFPAQWARDGWRIGHPSTRQPVGAWVMRSATRGWGFAPLGEDATPKNLMRWANITDCRPLYFLKVNIAPGQTYTTRFAVTDAATTDPAKLIDGYKRSHWLAYPTHTYATTQEPIAAIFNFSDPLKVSPSNPYGYRDAGHDMTGATGLTPWMSDQVKACRDLGCAELVVWNPGGIAPPCALNPDFAPMRISRAMQSLCTIAAPMRVILGARMGIVADPAAPNGFRERYTPEDFQDLSASIRRAIDWGVHGFYWDEGGTRINDPAIAELQRRLLADAGRIAAGFSERITDVMTPDIGGYTNCFAKPDGPFLFHAKSDGTGAGITAADVAFLRWLRPGFPFVVQLREILPDRIEAAYRAVARLGARVLIPWWDAKRWVSVWRRVQAEVQQEQVDALWGTP